MDEYSAAGMFIAAAFFLGITLGHMKGKTDGRGEGARESIKPFPAGWWIKAVHYAEVERDLDRSEEE